MKTCKIIFQARTIHNNLDIGSISGNVYTLRHYLNNAGLNFSLQKLYKITNPVEYLIEGDNINNVTCDWDKRDKKKDGLPIHIRIERLPNDYYLYNTRY